MTGPTTVTGMGTSAVVAQNQVDHGFGQAMQQGTGTTRTSSNQTSPTAQANLMAQANLTGRTGLIGQASLTGRTNTGPGTLVGSGTGQAATLVGTGGRTAATGGTGASPVVARSQGAGTADATAAVRALSVPDQNGNGIYELSDRQGVRTPTVRELATAIRESGADKVLVGEIHPTAMGGGSMIQSNPNFWALALEVRNQGRAEGQKVLLAIEQQASPDQQDLLRKLNSGKMAPGIFEQEWVKAAAENHRRVGGPERPDWVWQSEARDIVRTREQGFMVAYIDPNRFGGGERERGMARAIERESSAYGDNVITLARVGGAHSAVQTVADTGEIPLNGWKKPIQASNWQNPAGRILDEKDDAGTLSIMIDAGEERSIANPNAPRAESYGVIRPVPHGGWEFIVPGLTQ